MFAHCRWFHPYTPASATTKTGRHDIAEILSKVALNTKNQINHHYIHDENKLTNNKIMLKSIGLRWPCGRECTLWLLKQGVTKRVWTCHWPLQHSVVVWELLQVVVYVQWAWQSQHKARIYVHRARCVFNSSIITSIWPLSYGLMRTGETRTYVCIAPSGGYIICMYKLKHRCMDSIKS